MNLVADWNSNALIEKDLTIVNHLGLHARAAKKLVSTASAFASDITVKRGNRSANGKSILGVMMLAASKGMEIRLCIDGNDETAAMAALEALIADRFGEDE